MCKLENDVDFLYLLADAAVQAFQDGNPDVLCSPLVDAKKSWKDLVEVYANYVKKIFLGSFGASLGSYDQQNLKNVTPEDSGNKLIDYGGFKFAQRLHISKWHQQMIPFVHQRLIQGTIWTFAKNIFGQGVYPDVDMTNIYYGGTKISGTRIIFTNGSQDPWRHASKQNWSKELPSYLIKCHNCGHGTDLRGCPQSPFSIEGDAANCTSPEVVQKVRQQIIQHIDLWLSERQATGCV